MRSAAGFTGFATWGEVLAVVRSDKPLYYWAPLDYRPALLCLNEWHGLGTSVGKGSWSKKIWVAAPGACGFWADAGHLDRFYIKEA